MALNGCGRGARSRRRWQNFCSCGARTRFGRGSRAPVAPTLAGRDRGGAGADSSRPWRPARAIAPRPTRLCRLAGGARTGAVPLHQDQAHEQAKAAERGTSHDQDGYQGEDVHVLDPALAAPAIRWDRHSAEPSPKQGRPQQRAGWQRHGAGRWACCGLPGSRSFLQAELADWRARPGSARRARRFVLACNSHRPRQILRVERRPNGRRVRSAEASALTLCPIRQPGHLCGERANSCPSGRACRGALQAHQRWPGVPALAAGTQCSPLK